MQNMMENKWQWNLVQMDCSTQRPVLVRGPWYCQEGQAGMRQQLRWHLCGLGGSCYCNEKSELVHVSLKPGGRPTKHPG